MAELPGKLVPGLTVSAFDASVLEAVAIANTIVRRAPQLEMSCQDLFKSLLFLDGFTYSDKLLIGQMLLDIETDEELIVGAKLWIPWRN